MYNFNKSSDLPAFDIFEKLFQLVLNCKWEGDTIARRDSEAIKAEHIPLLFAWTGILEMHLATLTGNKEYSQQLHNLNKLLDGNVEYLQLHDFVDNIIETKSVPPKPLRNKLIKAQQSLDIKEESKLWKQIRKYEPKILEISFLLMHPKSIVMRNRPNLRRSLGYSCGNFSILCCMIAKLIRSGKEDAIITKRELYDMLWKFKTAGKYDIYTVSAHWTQYINYRFDKNLKSFVSSNIKGKGSIKYHKDSIKVPSIQRVLHEIKTESSGNYAILKKFDDPINNTDMDLFSCEVAININKNEFFEYILWHMRLKKEISDKNYESVYLFLDKNGRGKDTLTNLIIRLYQVAKQSSLMMQSVIESWEEFLDNPAEIAESNLVKYDDWIFSLIENYETRDEFFNFKAFSRIIGDLDTDLEYEIIKEVRDEYKRAKYYHIPIELRQKLLEAKDELDIFVKLVIKKIKLQEGKLGAEKAILHFFDVHKEKYSYLNLLEHDDIEKIKFSTEANASRNNQRKILPIINKKLGGKDFGGSTLRILLGLETGDAEYLKYSS